MNIIVPACGLSTRFPKRKLKWLLTDPSGKLMIQKALTGLSGGYEKIYLVVNKMICADFSKQELKNIMSQYRDVEIVVLQHQTSSQVETVAEAIKVCNIDGPIYVKDTDNYFETEVCPGNYVSTYSLDGGGIAYEGKSYVKHEGENITEIVEKKVISSTFCCGGYSFLSALQFLFYSQGKLYISDVIKDMMKSRIDFKFKMVEGYIDWGDLEVWEKYRSKYRTLFIDIDGVMVLNAGEYGTPKWGETAGILENVRYINSLVDTGKTQVVLVTARPEIYRKITEDQLSSEGVKYHVLVMGLLHAKRILINDYSLTNPYMSCAAVNVKRNTGIEDQLAGVL
jgi:ribonucleotide monophosphatase NagD (HAD superfamily)